MIESNDLYYFFRLKNCQKQIKGDPIITLTVTCDIEDQYLILASIWRNNVFQLTYEFKISFFNFISNLPNEKEFIDEFIKKANETYEKTFLKGS